MESINKLKSSLPFFTLIFASLGYIKLYSRYEFLGIDIVNYLDFSEILLLFIKEIIIGFFVLIFIVFIYSISKKTLLKIEKLRELELKKAKILRKIWIHFKAVLPLVLLSILIQLFHYVYDKNLIIDQGEKAYRLHFGLSYALSILIAFTAMLFILNIIQSRFKNIDLKIKSQIKYLILAYTVLSMVIYFGNQALTYRDKVRGEKKVNIITNDLEIFTNQHMPYMGETRNYIFVYDNHNCETIVINKKDIESLSYGYNDQKID